MLEIENFGFMTADDKAKLDSISTDTLLTKANIADSDVTVSAANKDGDGNIISETYVKKSDFKKCITDVQVDEKGVTLFNGDGEPVIILPVVAPKI